MTQRRNLLIVLFAFFLIIGGSGGYLLWRVNQEQTVTPEDSDASEILCVEEKRVVSFSELESDAGHLEVSSNYNKAVIDEVNNYISQIFEDSCDNIDTIKAVAKEGYIFRYWENDAGEQVSSASEITIRYSDLTAQQEAKFKAVFAIAGDKSIMYTVKYSAQCEGYAGEPNALLVCSETGCLEQSVPEGGSSVPVYISTQIGIPCEFKYWEVDEVRYTEKEHQINGITSDTKVSVIFEYTDSPFSLKYSSESEGYLMVNKEKVEEYPVIIDLDPDKPLPQIPEIEAVPNAGWAFDRWQSRTPDALSIEDEKKNPRKDEDKKRDLDIIALYKTGTERLSVSKYTLVYEAGKGGKLSKGGGVSSTLPISVSVDSGNGGPSVKAVADTGYKFVYWIDNATGTKDVSTLATSNPRKDMNITKGISVKAYFESISPPEPLETGDTPEVSDTPDDPVVPSSTESDDTMPQTAAMPNKSLYIMTLGTLILCLGMIWQYLPGRKVMGEK